MEKSKKNQSLLNDQDGLYSKLSTLVCGKGVGGTGVKFTRHQARSQGPVSFFLEGERERILGTRLTSHAMKEESYYITGDERG